MGGGEGLLSFQVLKIEEKVVGDVGRKDGSGVRLASRQDRIRNGLKRKRAYSFDCLFEPFMWCKESGSFGK